VNNYQTQQHISLYDATTPITVEQIMIAKHQLLEEFFANDAALSEVQMMLLAEQNAAMVEEDRSMHLDQMFGRY